MTSVGSPRLGSSRLRSSGSLPSSRRTRSDDDGGSDAKSVTTGVPSDTQSVTTVGGVGRVDELDAASVIGHEDSSSKGVRQITTITHGFALEGLTSNIKMGFNTTQIFNALETDIFNHIGVDNKNKLVSFLKKDESLYAHLSSEDRVLKRKELVNSVENLQFSTLKVSDALQLLGSLTRALEENEIYSYAKDPSQLAKTLVGDIRGTKHDKLEKLFSKALMISLLIEQCHYEGVYKGEEKEEIDHYYSSIGRDLVVCTYLDENGKISLGKREGPEKDIKGDIFKSHVTGYYLEKLLQLKQYQKQGKGRIFGSHQASFTASDVDVAKGEIQSALLSKHRIDYLKSIQPLTFTRIIHTDEIIREVANSSSFGKKIDRFATPDQLNKSVLETAKSTLNEFKEHNHSSLESLKNLYNNLSLAQILDNGGSFKPTDSTETAIYKAYQSCEGEERKIIQLITNQLNDVSLRKSLIDKLLKSIEDKDTSFGDIELFDRTDLISELEAGGVIEKGVGIEDNSYVKNFFDDNGKLTISSFLGKFQDLATEKPEAKDLEHILKPVKFCFDDLKKEFDKGKIAAIGGKTLARNIRVGKDQSQVLSIQQFGNQQVFSLRTLRDLSKIKSNIITALKEDGLTDGKYLQADVNLDFLLDHIKNDSALKKLFESETQDSETFCANALAACYEDSKSDIIFTPDLAHADLVSLDKTKLTEHSRFVNQLVTWLNTGTDSPSGDKTCFGLNVMIRGESHVLFCNTSDKIAVLPKSKFTLGTLAEGKKDELKSANFFTGKLSKMNLSKIPARLVKHPAGLVVGSDKLFDKEIQEDLRNHMLRDILSEDLLERSQIGFDSVSDTMYEIEGTLTWLQDYLKDKEGAIDFDGMDEKLECIGFWDKDDVKKSELQAFVNNKLNEISQRKDVEMSLFAKKLYKQIIGKITDGSPKEAMVILKSFFENFQPGKEELYIDFDDFDSQNPFVVFVRTTLGGSLTQQEITFLQNYKSGKTDALMNGLKNKLKDLYLESILELKFSSRQDINEFFDRIAVHGDLDSKVLADSDTYHKLQEFGLSKKEDIDALYERLYPQEGLNQAKLFLSSENQLMVSELLGGSHELDSFKIEFDRLTEVLKRKDMMGIKFFEYNKTELKAIYRKICTRFGGESLAGFNRTSLIHVLDSLKTQPITSSLSQPIKDKPFSDQAKKIKSQYKIKDFGLSKRYVPIEMIWIDRLDGTRMSLHEMELDSGKNHFSSCLKAKMWGSDADKMIKSIFSGLSIPGGGGAISNVQDLLSYISLTDGIFDAKELKIPFSMRRSAIEALDDKSGVKARLQFLHHELCERFGYAIDPSFGKDQIIKILTSLNYDDELFKKYEDDVKNRYSALMSDQQDQIDTKLKEIKANLDNSHFSHKDTWKDYLEIEALLKGVRSTSVKKEDDEGTKSYKQIFNAHKRENFQRNQISKALDKANEDDLIMISDVDEIPNLKDLNVARVNNKIVIFEQEIFYYKLNRYLEGFTWHGTKACKKKNLKSPQWIRNVKNKKFGFWRLDTFFSETKYINKIFIKSGGWHFSNLKNPVDIENKLKSYLHHRDFDVENIDLKEISKLMKNNETIYDMFADKREKKFSENKRKLNLYPKNKLPQYISGNESKFKEWLD